MIRQSDVEKIRNRYDGEHDLDPSPNAPPVTWREMVLLEMIEDLQQQIDGLRAQIEEPESIAETVRRNADAAHYQHR